ncbi:MAG: hypothetical protein B6I30_01490 [Desulfobacteraceae bacterium 4572_187]|nr:MAG: hypothetical protein B6I30_01490 [Desulfobacteraceae bacterium 4572_187]
MELPNELQESFQRLMNHLPYQLKNDGYTQQVILTFLKFGGEKLARQYIEISKMNFSKKAIKKISEIQTSSDIFAAGSHISKSDSPEDDSLEFPTK